MSINIDPLYGLEVLRFGKWIVTTKGILFERWQSGEVDYFLEEISCGDMAFMKTSFSSLLEVPWLGEVDYQQLISAWFYKLSLLKIKSLQSGLSLSEVLLELQAMLENKFSGNLTR